MKATTSGSQTIRFEPVAVAAGFVGGADSGRAAGASTVVLSARASHSATMPANPEQRAPMRSAPLSPSELDQDEAGEERAGDRAQGVGRIQAPERLAQLGRPREVADERGERGAHHDRGRREGEDGENQSSRAPGGAFPRAPDRCPGRRR